MASELEDWIEMELALEAGGFGKVEVETKGPRKFTITDQRVNIMTTKRREPGYYWTRAETDSDAVYPMPPGPQVRCWTIYSEVEAKGRWWGVDGQSFEDDEITIIGERLEPPE